MTIGFIIIIFPECIKSRKREGADNNRKQYSYRTSVHNDVLRCISDLICAIHNTGFGCFSVPKKGKN